MTTDSNGSPPVLFSVDDDGVALIQFNRPDRMNAMGADMLEPLEAYYRRCDEDDGIRAVVVTGSGRAFCAGADLSDAEATFDIEGSVGFDDFSAAAIAFPAFRIRKLVVAAVNGHAVGLGMTLAMQCDLRIFAEEGKYGIVQVRRGVMGDAYSHWTVTRLVGLAKAAEMMLTGKTFRGPELERLGVANQILPAESVLDAALEIARDTARNAAPLSVAVSKKLLWEAMDLSAEQVEHKETELHKHIMPKADAIEGPVAHVQRRAPEWKLRVGRDWPATWPGDDEG